MKQQLLLPLHLIPTSHHSKPLHPGVPITLHRWGGVVDGGQQQRQQ
jgi:hypothetical protein